MKSSDIVNHLLKPRSAESLSPHRMVLQGSLGGFPALSELHSVDPGKDLKKKKKFSEFIGKF